MASLHEEGTRAADPGVMPRLILELLMATVGRFFGSLCDVTGFFGPMYAAGRLEAMNVDQYAAARESASRRDQIRAHRLLPRARTILGWSPPA